MKNPDESTPRRVLVTRAPHQARPLLEALRQQGFDAVACPVLAIEGVAGETPDLAACDLVVITSPNGVDHLAARLEDTRWPDTTELAVVGPGTAARAREHGWPVHHQPDQATGEALAAMLTADGLQVLRVRGDLAPPLIEDTLRAQGATVTSLTVYRTVSVPPPPAVAADLEAGAVDAVTFASPSAVRALLRGVAGVDLPACTVAACIGPVTAAAVREAGWQRICEADEASPAALAMALREFFTSPPRT